MCIFCIFYSLECVYSITCLIILQKPTDIRFYYSSCFVKEIQMQDVLILLIFFISWNAKLVISLLIAIKANIHLGSIIYSLSRFSHKEIKDRECIGWYKFHFCRHNHKHDKCKQYLPCVTCRYRIKVKNLRDVIQIFIPLEHPFTENGSVG